MKRTGKIVLTVIILVAIGGATYAVVSSKNKSDDDKIRTVTVLRGDIVDKALAVGTIEPRVDLIFRGTVDEIDVGRLKEGMPCEIKVGALPNATVKAQLSKIWLKEKKRKTRRSFQSNSKSSARLKKI